MPGEHLLEELGRFDGDAEILQAWRDGMAPEPALLVSEWADKHRILSSRGSAEPGPWRTSRTPYLKEVMDALSPAHPARRVVFMKGAQVGGTECGNGWIGYVIHHAPGPMLAVQPTTELAKRFSDQRIDPLIEETRAIRERVAPARSRDSGNRQLSKEFPGGRLVMTGANSAVGLRPMSARFLFLDEIDAYAGDVEGEGDPIALAEARARTFGWRRKVFLVSTPTIAGLSRIEREYLATDQRRYFLPCPHCLAMQWLRFERLVWDDGEPETARYLCEACDAPIGEQHKAAMLAAGTWRATATATDPHAIGFHILALYSPPGWMPWSEIARLWLAAQGDDRAIKTFRNTVLGETWQEAGEAPDWQRLYDRREHWPAGKVPAGGLLLTAGVDVQRDRLEASIWAWGQDRQSWLVRAPRPGGEPVRGGGAGGTAAAARRDLAARQRAPPARGHGRDRQRRRHDHRRGLRLRAAVRRRPCHRREGSGRAARRDRPAGGDGGAAQRAEARWLEGLAGGLLLPEGRDLRLAEVGAADGRERRSVPRRLRASARARRGRGVLPSAHRRAAGGARGPQRLSPTGMGEDQGTQRGARLPGLRPRGCGGGRHGRMG